MLFCTLIDVLFILLGLIVGIAIMACVSASGYEHKCDDCIYREICEVKNE